MRAPSVGVHDRDHRERADEREQLWSDVEEGAAHESGRDRGTGGEQPGPAPPPPDPRGRWKEGRSDQDFEGDQGRPTAAPKEVEEQDLREPLLVEPGCARVGEGEDVARRDLAVLEDVTAGREVPPEVLAGDVLRRGVEGEDREGGEEEQLDQTPGARRQRDRRCGGRLRGRCPLAPARAARRSAAARRFAHRRPPNARESEPVKADTVRAPTSAPGGPHA